MKFEAAPLLSVKHLWLDGVWLADYPSWVALLRRACLHSGSRWSIYDVDNASVWQRLFDKAAASDAAAVARNASQPKRIGRGKNPSATTAVSKFHKVESLLQLHQIVFECGQADRKRSTSGKYVAVDVSC